MRAEAELLERQLAMQKKEAQLREEMAAFDRLKQRRAYARGARQRTRFSERHAARDEKAVSSEEELAASSPTEGGETVGAEQDQSLRVEQEHAENPLHRRSRHGRTPSPHGKSDEHGQSDEALDEVSTRDVVAERVPTGHPTNAAKLSGEEMHAQAGRWDARARRPLLRIGLHGE